MPRSPRPMAAPLQGDPALKFLQQLWAVVHELQRVSKRMESTLRLTGPQRVALLMIGRAPHISAGELASLLHLHPATLTGILERLERAGLIARVWDAADGRRMRLTLTPAGQVANRRRTGTVEAAVRRALAATPRGESDIAARVLDRLAASLHAVAAGAAVRSAVARRLQRTGSRRRSSSRRA